MPADDPFGGFDLEMLREDVLGGVDPMPALRRGMPPFFAEAG